MIRNEPPSPPAGPGSRAAGALLLMLLLVSCGPPAAPTAVAVGAPAPSFELEDLEGTRVESATWKGRPTLINFWATWCQPCRKEKPELVALAEGGRIAVVGIALDEGGAETVAPFVEQHRPPYDILLGDKETFRRFGGYTIPYSLLVDRDGTVVEIYRAPVTRKRVEGDLAAVTPAAS